MALLLRLTLLLALVLLSGCSSVFFYPMNEWVQNPTRQGLDYEDIVLIHEDGMRLHGWWLPAATDEVKGTVYHLHGNAQNISTHLMSVAWLPERGYQVFLLDYRGYGLSEGRARLPDVQEDVQLGLDWLHSAERVEGPLIVYGQSLGGSLTASVMGREQNQGRADCVIIEAAFTGYRDITRDVMRGSWLLWPFSFIVAPLIPDQDRPLDQVPRISTTPLLIMHSEEDEIIPLEHGKRLYDAAQDPKTFQRLRGRHIHSTRAEDVRDFLVDFMEGC